MVKLVMCNMILENNMSLDVVQYTTVNTFHCKDVAETDLRSKAFKLIVKRDLKIS